MYCIVHCQLHNDIPAGVDVINIGVGMLDTAGGNVGSMVIHSGADVTICGAAVGETVAAAVVTHVRKLC